MCCFCPFFLSSRLMVSSGHSDFPGWSCLNYLWQYLGPVTVHPGGSEAACFLILTSRCPKKGNYKALPGRGHSSRFLRGKYRSLSPKEKLFSRIFTADPSLPFWPPLSSGDGRGLVDDFRHGDQGPAGTREGALTSSRCALVTRAPLQGLACCGVVLRVDVNTWRPHPRGSWHCAFTAPPAPLIACVPGAVVGTGELGRRPGERGGEDRQTDRDTETDRERDGYAGADMRTDRHRRRHRRDPPRLRAAGCRDRSASNAHPGLPPSWVWGQSRWHC